MTPFAAVLLAGGRSRRMGRDKALLPMADGRLLWQRQLAVLQDLGPTELFISGPARKNFPTTVPLLTDETPGLGPLTGIVAALRAMRSPLLVVLAVDLPAMTTAFLLDLLARAGDATATRGVVPQTADTFYEPLAAIYPVESLASAEKHLKASDRSLQTFVRALVQNGQAVARPVGSRETPLFANWNQPGDLPTAAAD